MRRANKIKMGLFLIGATIFIILSGYAAYRGILTYVSPLASATCDCNTRKLFLVIDSEPFLLMYAVGWIIAAVFILGVYGSVRRWMD